MKIRFRHHSVFVLLLLVAAAGCSPVRFISDYDEQTDQATTALHRKIEGMMVALEEAPHGGGADDTAIEATYREVLVDLRALTLRAASRPMNDLQVRQFEELENQLGMFGTALREGISPQEVPLFRRGFDQTFRAILTLELAKKRGEG